VKYHLISVENRYKSSGLIFSNLQTISPLVTNTHNQSKIVLQSVQGTGSRVSSSSSEQSIWVRIEVTAIISKVNQAQLSVDTLSLETTNFVNRIQYLHGTYSSEEVFIDDDDGLLKRKMSFTIPYYYASKSNRDIFSFATATAAVTESLQQSTTGHIRPMTTTPLFPLLSPQKKSTTGSGGIFSSSSSTLNRPTPLSILTTITTTNDDAMSDDENTLLTLDSVYTRSNILQPQSILTTPRGNQLGTPRHVQTINNRVRILIVDNSSMTRHRIRSSLERCGYQVIEAESGKEALTMIVEGTVMMVDALLIDWQMLSMDGIETTRKIRQYELKLLGDCYTNPRTHSHSDLAMKKRLTIVGLSKYVDTLMIQESYDAGCDGLMTKPFSITDFMEIFVRLNK
jgi:CheY-like chemotaxis protein